MAMINKAIMFATLAHEKQKRKGTDIPYIFHPILIKEATKKDNDIVKHLNIEIPLMLTV